MSFVVVQGCSYKLIILDASLNEGALAPCFLMVINLLFFSYVKL